jgi:hypothetical protein
MDNINRLLKAFQSINGSQDNGERRMRGYRKNKQGFLVKIQKHSVARVDDTATGKRRYFETYEEASAFADKAFKAAVAANQQSEDRFYIWSAGESYSVGAHNVKDEGSYDHFNRYIAGDR